MDVDGEILKKLSKIESDIKSIKFDIIEINKKIGIKEKISLPEENKIIKKNSLYDPALFERLRKVRLELAKREDMPAFYIFTDKVLTDLAYEKPISYEKLIEIKGIGEEKLNKYGDYFLEEIIKYLKETNQFKYEK